MANVTRAKKRTKKAGVAARGPFALHLKNQDGSQTVCLGNLRALITRHEDGWIAQGLEIDYAIDGVSVEDVKVRFLEGLTLTVKTHLRVYGDINRMLKIAPQPVWDKFYAAVPPDLQHHGATVTVHFLGRERNQMLPFDKIIYAQAA